jgi:hypothetical protein
MDLSHDVELYAGVRQVAALSDIGVPSYCQADVRVSWRATRNLELSVAGTDVLRMRHVETSQPPPLQIPRNVYAELRWTF